MTRRHDGAHDDGAALVIVLVLVVVGSLLTTGVARFLQAGFRAARVMRERAEGAEAVESGIRMAVAMQRDIGPGPCATVPAQTLGGMQVTVTCTPTTTTRTVSNGRLGVITTGFTTSDAALVGPTSGALALHGDVFLSGGRLDQASTIGLSGTLELTRGLTVGSPSPARYVAPGGGAARVCDDPALRGSAMFAAAPDPTCTSELWTARVGDVDGTTGVRKAPALPPVPTESRSAPIDVAGCKVFFPGRYTGAVTLGSGTAYFASGVYYLEGTLTVGQGAVVVAGDGPTAGCVTDAEANFDPRAPIPSLVSGRGVLFVLGAGGRIAISGAGTSVALHPRVPVAGEPGYGLSVISAVSPARDTADALVPESLVQLADGSVVTVAAHSITPPGGSAVRYRGSTLQRGDRGVDVALGSSARVAFGGGIVVPQARVVVSSVDSSGVVRMEGGVVAHGLTLALRDPGPDVFVGTPDQQVTVQRYTMRAEARPVSGPGPVSVSTAVVDIGASGDYAIVTWELSGR